MDTNDIQPYVQNYYDYIKNHWAAEAQIAKAKEWEAKGMPFLFKIVEGKTGHPHFITLDPEQMIITEDTDYNVVDKKKGTYEDAVSEFLSMEIDEDMESNRHEFMQRKIGQGWELRSGEFFEFVVSPAR